MTESGECNFWRDMSADRQTRQTRLSQCSATRRGAGKNRPVLLNIKREYETLYEWTKIQGAKTRLPIVSNLVHSYEL